MTRYGDRGCENGLRDERWPGCGFRRSIIGSFETQYDGIWTLGKRVKMNRVFDGLSYTYLLGEKAMDSLEVPDG